MVFSSWIYIGVFLPIVFILYHLVSNLYISNLPPPSGRASSARSHLIAFNLGIFVLVISSLIFYGYWKWRNLWIICSSIVFNYIAGRYLVRFTSYKKYFFIFCVAVNLGLLFFFKYTDFSISTINAIAKTSIPLTGIILPIGISFFTFQQIAYLSDIYTGKHDPSNETFINYSLFVTFFPQLIAGPIVHHGEMMPQFADERNRAINWDNVYTGICLFIIGLSKKVLIADQLSPIVHQAFDILQDLSFLDALSGMFAYAMQLYFDFSGYSDMAIGAALLFNIKLPINFNTPYRATSIQDFWRRWHMTLSRWLRDYLYIPLGGNRNGHTLRNLFITFLLGGLWHGAAWTFVLWGLIHGVALVIHRAWSRIFCLQMPPFLGWLSTFLFISIAWIPFRANNLKCINNFLDGFSGIHGFWFTKKFIQSMPYNFINSWIWLSLLIVAMILAVFFRNSNEMLKWKNLVVFRIFLVILFSLVGLILVIPDSVQEFMYFQF